MQRAALAAASGFGSSASRRGSDRRHFQSASSATTSGTWSYRGLGSMALLDTCSLNSLPPVRPLQGRPHPSHPWKKACPPSFRKELPPAHCPSPAAWKHLTPTPTARWHRYVSSAWWPGAPEPLRNYKRTRTSLPHQHSLRPFWRKCGTLEQFVPASVLSQKFPCKGRECLSMKKSMLAAWKSVLGETLITIDTSVAPPSPDSGKRYWAEFFADIANWLGAGESVTGPVG